MIRHRVMVIFILCISAIKAKISRVRDDNNGNKILYLKKNKKFYKKTNISKRDKKYLNPVLLNGAHCECDIMTQSKSRYIIMGNKTETGFTVSYISLWQKNKDFRRATRAMKKGNVECKSEILQLATQEENSAERIPNRRDKSTNRKRTKKNKKNKKRGKKRDRQSQDTEQTVAPNSF